MLTQSRLKELLSYDPDTGQFTRLIRAGHSLAGTIAGGQRTDGYLEIGIDGISYRSHRLAFLYMVGRWPIPQADHKNTIRSDNRWDNLREATLSQNGANQPRRITNKSGFKGVDRRGDGRFRARIRDGNISVFLGYFSDAGAAHAAYCAAAARLHGEFARAS